MNKKSRQDHIENNYNVFKKKLEKGDLDLVIGKYVLIVNEDIKSYFDTRNDAIRAGRLLGSEVIYSVQEVTNTPADLWCYVENNYHCCNRS